MNGKDRIIEIIDEKSAAFTGASDKIWDYAETRFNLPKSADALCAVLEQEGFDVQRGACDMDDAIIATYGSGKPVIGILGEYDALPALSQQADMAAKEPIVDGAPGHGCGHNALGAGALAGAVGIKAYMQEAGIKGTIKFFGCPAEESGSGKAFMARGGAFDGLDGVLSWHPMNETAVWGFSSLANYQVYFKFKGVSSHAAAAPEHGRSALDAAELMNVGVNYLREHVVQEARIHYAYHDVGGEFPNVVQPTAKLLYFIRAPRSSQVKEIYERVVDVAKGAAIMTGTELEIEWDSACAEFIVNDVLSKAMYANMQKLGNIQFSDDDFAYAKQYTDGLGEQARANYNKKLQAMFPDMDAARMEQLCTQPIMDELVPYTLTDTAMAGSTDVGDASWQAPTAQLTTPSFPVGTVAHSWQFVACGKSGMAHKGLLYAGKVMAMTALDMLQDSDMLKQAQDEFAKRLDGESYYCPIPADVKPV